MGTTKITAAGTQQIDMEREFDAPRDLLFRAHTDPDLLVQWLGPRDEKMRLERLEARDGGTYRYIFKGSDGNEHGFHGVFHGTPLAGGHRPDLRVRRDAWPRQPGLHHLRGARRQDPVAGKVDLPIGRGPRQHDRVGHGTRCQRGL